MCVVSFSGDGGGGPVSSAGRYAGSAAADARPDTQIPPEFTSAQEAQSQQQMPAAKTGTRGC